MVDKLSECLTRGQLTSYHLNKSSLQNISWSSWNHSEIGFTLIVKSYISHLLKR